MRLGLTNQDGFKHLEWKWLNHIAMAILPLRYIACSAIGTMLHGTDLNPEADDKAARTQAVRSRRFRKARLTDRRVPSASTFATVDLAESLQLLAARGSRGGLAFRVPGILATKPPTWVRSSA